MVKIITNRENTKHSCDDEFRGIVESQLKVLQKITLLPLEKPNIYLKAHTLVK